MYLIASYTRCYVMSHISITPSVGFITLFTVTTARFFHLHLQPLSLTRIFITCNNQYTQLLLHENKKSMFPKQTTVFIHRGEISHFCHQIRSLRPMAYICNQPDKYAATTPPTPVPHTHGFINNPYLWLVLTARQSTRAAAKINSGAHW